MSSLTANQRNSLLAQLSLRTSSSPSPTSSQSTSPSSSSSKPSSFQNLESQARPDYSDLPYWETRYSDSAAPTYEWVIGYENPTLRGKIKDFIVKHQSATTKLQILHPGCGE